MQHLPRFLLAATALAAFASAQQSILFTGRFPFVSLDQPNERLGGAMTQLEEFDFTRVTPAPGAVARTLLPATAMQCYFGDANNDGSYRKFAGLKTYFQNFQLGGLFVKAGDRAAVSWDRVYFTVRDDVATADLEVFTNNGTAVQTLVPGDWIRLMPNGNVEFFMTAAQLTPAIGLQPGAGSIGAHALLQSATGDLYYVPVAGGHWVNGQQGGAVSAADGAIIKIDAANVVYDANGNVASLAANSARILINEATNGPNGTSVRQLALNSNCMNRDGLPLVTAGVYGKTCGLAFDPNGGTFVPSYPDALGNYNPEPNLLFCSDAGSYAGTIWSTANNGTVAVINGEVCGSLTLGVPATGSWLGVQFDYANFQPSMMGFTLVDGFAYEPLVLDQGNFGTLPVASAQATWDIDVGGPQFLPVYVLVTLGPGAPGLTVPSVPLGILPLGLFSADSHQDLFLVTSPLTLGVTVTDFFGYGTVSVGNPNNGSFAGLTLMTQALGLTPNGFQLSTPVLTQLD